jgi:hypothetical protein
VALVVRMTLFAVPAWCFDTTTVVGLGYCSVSVTNRSGLWRQINAVLESTRIPLWIRVTSSFMCAGPSYHFFSPSTPTAITYVVVHRKVDVAVVYDVFPTIRASKHCSKRIILTNLSYIMLSIRLTSHWLLLLMVAVFFSADGRSWTPSFAMPRSSPQRAKSLSRVRIQPAEVEPSPQMEDGSGAIAAPVTERKNSPFFFTHTPSLYTIALILLVAPGASQAGLLEEYGVSTSSTQSTAPITVVAPTASGGNAGSVQIDPTLRGCTFYEYVFIP